MEILEEEEEEDSHAEMMSPVQLGMLVVSSDSDFNMDSSSLDSDSDFDADFFPNISFSQYRRDQCEKKRKVQKALK